MHTKRSALVFSRLFSICAMYDSIYRSPSIKDMYKPPHTLLHPSLPALYIR